MRALLFSFILAMPLQLSGAPFDRSAAGGAAVAMGGTAVAPATRTSAIYANPAGIVSLTTFTIYGDYMEPRNARAEARTAFVAPLGGTAVGLGWYRLEADEERIENLFTASLARRVLEGAQGSYLSIGAALKVGRVLSRRSGGCACGHASSSRLGGDIGVMVKPLPVISVGYSLSNVTAPELDIGGETVRWERVNRLGIAYHWEERVVAAFEYERRPGRSVFHYGISLLTGYDVELMAGFSEERVSGGIGWRGQRLGALVAFRAVEGGGVETLAALEIFAGGPRSGEGESR